MDLGSIFLGLEDSTGVKVGGTGLLFCDWKVFMLVKYFCASGVAAMSHVCFSKWPLLLTPASRRKTPEDVLCGLIWERFFSSSSLSAIRVVSSAYLRLLIFLPAILIPAYASSSPAFPMMGSAYKLNKQVGNISLWCTTFLIWNQSVVPSPVLTYFSGGR